MRISDWSSDVCSSDLHRGAIEQLHARNDRVPVHIETSHPITDPSHRIYPLQAQRPPEGNQERIRICGSCSKRHSPVPRVPHQTDNGLEATRNNADHTPPATTSISSPPPWPPGHRACTHLTRSSVKPTGPDHSLWGGGPGGG